MVFIKQFTIRGSMEYPSRVEDASTCCPPRDLSSLITHRVPLERSDDALRLLQGSKECGKVLVRIDPTAQMSAS